MKKMQEIELLKYLLFEESSIYLFNFLAGKIDLFNSDQNSYNFTNLNLQDKTKASYTFMKRNTKIRFIDEKILNMFEIYLEKSEH